MRLDRLAILAVVLSFAPHAVAEPEDATRAQSLFEEARTLMAAGKYVEACPKLEESQRLDPGGGTLMNLAACHENLGLLATAWAEYQLALDVAKRDRRDDREREIQPRLAALAPRLSRIQLEVDPRNPPDLELRRDDQPIARSAWAEAIPVDPGKHLIVASAPGRRSLRIEVASGAEADLDKVGIPLLEDLTPHPLITQKPPARETPAPAPARGDRGRRTAGFATLGAGAFVLGVGTYFGIRALSKKSESDEICTETVCSPGDSRAVDLNDDARRSAWIANVAIGAGLLASGVGVYLLLSARDDESPASGMALRVAPVARGASLGVAKRW